LLENAGGKPTSGKSKEKSAEPRASLDADFDFEISGNVGADEAPGMAFGDSAGGPTASNPFINPMPGLFQPEPNPGFGYQLMGLGMNEAPPPFDVIEEL
jgi:hypothetical protein